MRAMDEMDGTDNSDGPRSDQPPAFARWISPAAACRFAALEAFAAPRTASVADLRAHYDRINTARLAVARDRYDVEIRPEMVGGVPSHVVEPRSGAPDDQILVCLHGGAFIWGDGAGALIEAVPVAAVSGIAVVAVGYRLAPEHRFPAAVDDVVAVVRELRRRRPGIRIGLYGCSAGAVLTAQVVARLIADRSPCPDAIAMLHAAGVEIGGDSLELAALTNGTADAVAVRALHDLSYFDGTDVADPLIFPGEHADLLAAFPPSLLVSGTRDFAASSVTVMHRRLKAAGREAELAMFDGMWHAHHVDVDLPESAEVFALLAAFFQRHLV